jgi:hypothetical protein
MGWLDQISAQQQREWAAKFKGAWWFYWQITSSGRIHAEGPLSIIQPAAALKEADMSLRYARPTFYRYIWLPAGFAPGSPARWALDKRPSADLFLMKPYAYPGPTGAVVSG